MKKILFYSLLILSTLSVFTFFEYVKFNDKSFHLVMCDVGQGEAIFITTSVKTQILIDGGPGKDVLDCLSNNMPFWDRSIDMVILTHPHADHYSGLLDVIDRYSLNSFFTQGIKSDSEGFKLLEAKLANKNLSAKYMKKNDSFKEKSGVKLKIIWPATSSLEEADQTNSNMNLNESSIVAILTYGNFSALLTGDAEVDDFARHDFSQEKIKVLKIPHHGSSGAVDEELLNQLKPELALISVGEGNKFGHPSAEVLELLEKFKVKYLRTYINGEIEIISDGNNYEVKYMR